MYVGGEVRTVSQLPSLFTFRVLLLLLLLLLYLSGVRRGLPLVLAARGGTGGDRVRRYGRGREDESSAEGVAGETQGFILVSSYWN